MNLLESIPKKPLSPLRLILLVQFCGSTSINASRH